MPCELLKRMAASAFVVILASSAIEASSQAPPDLKDPVARQQYYPAVNEQIKEHPNDYQPYCLRGFLYSLDNNLFAALADAKRADALKPHDPNILALLGQIHLQQGNFKASLPYLTAAINAQPGEAACYTNRANAYLKLNQLAEAQKDAVKAQELNPQLDCTYDVFAEISYRTGKYQKCVDYCNEAIRLNAEDPDAYYYRGCAYEKLGNKQQANADKNRGVKLGYTGRMVLRIKQ